MLKVTAPGVAGSLIDLFNFSLKTGEIPSEWKSANITPEFKNCSKEDVNNHRPVSVLPVVTKVFETIVHVQLSEYLERNFTSRSVWFSSQTHYLGCSAKGN